MSSTTSSSSSTSVSAIYSSNGVLHMSGAEFASGLDTQSLITAFTAKTTEKITKQQQLQQKAEWKRDMYREVESLLQTFADSYLSYSSGSDTNILSTSFFDSSELTSSNTNVVTATGASADAGNVVIDSITSLASASSFSSGYAVSKTSIDSGKALGTTISASSYLNLSMGGTSYTLSLGSNIDTSGKSASEIASALATQLNTQVSANSSLKDKVTFTANGDGSISMGGSGSTTITGASQNFIDGLGMTGTTSGTGTTYTMGGTVSASGLTSLSDQLAGITLTFSLDGTNKTVTFEQSESSQYSTASGVASYLQTKLASAYGSGKIAVTATNDKLSFSTADTSSVLKLSSSSDANALSTDGLLHIASGETNRTELTKSLSDLSGELNTALSPGSSGSYTINVNGKDFTFTADTELNTVINTINNDTTANVTVSYSQTLNQFRIVSDDTGSQGAISVKDVSGNLAASLFGGGTVIQSAALTAGTDGKYSTGTSDSTYSFTLGNGSAQTITVSGGQTYNSLADYAAAIQSSITANGNLSGVTVGVSSDGKKLTFQSTNGSSLKIAATGTTDVLGIGAGGQTAAGITSGKDLVMTAEFGGTTKTISRSTNSLTLDGITMNVTGTTSSKVTFSAPDSTDDLYSKISTFVDKYNEIIAKLNTDITTMPASHSGSNSTSSSGSSYEPLTDDQKKTMTATQITDWETKAKQGLLFSDAELSGLQSSLRTAIEGSVKSVGLSLADIGISTAPYDYTSGGKLIVNKTQLTNALKSEPDKVAQLFSNSDGVGARLKDVSTQYIGAYGTSGTLVQLAGSSTQIGVDNSQMTKEINDYTTHISELQTQLQSEQNRWQTKFTAMESAIYSLTNQYNYLSSMTSSSSS